MLEIELNVPLQSHNTFGILAKAHQLVRVRSEADLSAFIQHHNPWTKAPAILGGGSNLVLSADVEVLLFKIEIMGRALLTETKHNYIVEAGAGESWHDLVQWTLSQNLPGLENLALIPGTVGGACVQNIGAYGIELQDRFDSLDYIDLTTGQVHTLDAAACHFGYRDSIFKHALKGRALVTKARFALPKKWQAETSYADLERQVKKTNIATPSAQVIGDWVCEIRRSKLPDPKVVGNVGSFFKNPIVTEAQCKDIIGRDPQVVFYKLANGHFKLAAGWLIDACGWKGRGIGNAGVHPQHALVLINKQHETGVCATGGEVMTLASAIQTSVYERFGIRLELEPVAL